MHDMGMGQYLLIPFLDIFRGMNIHKSQLFSCEQKRGTIGFDTLPYKWEKQWVFLGGYNL